jgi:hypothetical protein
MPARPKTRPVDPNQLAHNVFLESIGEQPKTEAPDPENPRRIGGVKGGAARAAMLSAERKAAIARNAAAKRWEKSK